MSPPRAGCLTALWGALLLVALCAGCRPEAALPDETDAASVQPYAGTWDYAYGDSPVDAAGTPNWSKPTAAPLGSRPTRVLNTPPGRIGSQDLWLRSRLQGPSVRDPVLFLHEVDQCLRAYLDGKLIYEYGPMGAQASTFYAKQPLLIPLGDQYFDHTLTLHFKSPHRKIGVIRQPLIGSRIAVYRYMLTQGLPFLMVGGVAALLGLAMLIAYANKRSDVLYFYFSLSSTFLGMYMCSRSLARAYLFDHAVFWRYALVIGLGTSSSALSAFVGVLFGGRWAMVLYSLAGAKAALVLGGTLLVLSDSIHLETFFTAVLISWVPFLFLMIFSAVLGIRKRGTDSAVMAQALLLASISSTPILLGSLDIVNLSVDMRAFVAAIFLLSFGSILIRRYRGFYRRLANYSTVVQNSLGAGRDLDSREYIQQTLQLLLRSLQAERVFLFGCTEAGTGLHILAARTAEDRISNLSLAASAHDEISVEAVLRRRRPMSRLRLRPSADENSRSAQGDSQSVMAAPLLLQGRLLGVIYLEAARQRPEFNAEDLDILLGLGGQLAMTLTAVRANDLEVTTTHTRRLVGERGHLIAAAERLATEGTGNLVDIDAKAELAPLAQAIKKLCQDMVDKVHVLESSQAAIQQANADLTYQLNKRLNRVVKRERITATYANLSAAAARTTIKANAPTVPAEVKNEPQAAKSVEPAVLQPGQRLGQSYQIVRLLDDGGSSRVYEVERLADQRRLAAKILPQHASPALVARFLREAKILTSVRGAHIVSIVDIDVTDDGVPFQVMELLHGEPLDQQKTLYGRPDLALPVVRQVASGLSVLHQRGIIHRWLQPSNILAEWAGGIIKIRLVNFGYSAALEWAPIDIRSLGSQPRLSFDSMNQPFAAQGGNTKYRAPELQDSMLNASPKSDIYSLGLIAYELLTGEPLGEYLSSRRSLIPLYPRMASVPLSVSDLILRCLSSNPEQRPSAEDVLYALNQRLDLVMLIDKIGGVEARTAHESFAQAAKARSLSVEEVCTWQAIAVFDDLAKSGGEVAAFARQARIQLLEQKLPVASEPNAAPGRPLIYRMTAFVESRLTALAVGRLSMLSGVQVRKYGPTSEDNPQDLRKVQQALRSLLNPRELAELAAELGVPGAGPASAAGPRMPPGTDDKPRS
jgi:GAF domain-containing protein